MKLKSKHLMFIVGGIGGLLILFGAAQALFKFEVDKNISEKAVTFLFILAAVLYVYSKKKRKEETEQKEEEKTIDKDDANS